ncbi:MAG: XdhC family protein [Oricola sp.]|jgi:xanthine dehydrogenase accessory factor|nr:XdhC family protein [Oricola sp.]
MLDALPDTVSEMTPAAGFDPSGDDVLAFALAERLAGRKAAIVTLVEIDGASPRALGAQMAVAEDSRFAGSISSGCLERAIVEEARAAMMRGTGGVVRYGKGSRFLDVTLPCGSGVDLLFTVNPSETALQETCDALAARRGAAARFDADSMTFSDARYSKRETEDAFARVYTPALRIVAAGVGAELVLLSAIARAAGHLFCALSPDEKTLGLTGADETHRLNSSSSLPEIAIDPWTAFVFLFHDREWEVALAPVAVASPAFYIGAVGSRRTHAARVEALREAGLDDRAIARIEGPIGLIPATRDPSALAVSVLAGVLAAWPHGRE